MNKINIQIQEIKKKVYVSLNDTCINHIKSLNNRDYALCLTSNSEPLSNNVVKLIYNELISEYLDHFNMDKIIDILTIGDLM